MTFLQFFDVALALGLTLRLTRLVVADDIGIWWFKQPSIKWAGGSVRRHKLVSGLSCPYCVGFWIGCLVLLSLALVGGPGEAADAWRWVAGAFTLNWVSAHIAVRAGDIAYSQE